MQLYGLSQSIESMVTPRARRIDVPLSLCVVSIAKQPGAFFSSTYEACLVSVRSQQATCWLHAHENRTH